MYKDTKKTSNRKTLILAFVVILHACGLLFIAHVNDWFGMKTPYVQEEKPRLQEKEIENEKKIREKKTRDDVKNQMMAVNKIYLPRQRFSKKQMEKNIENIDRKSESPIERKEHLASKEQPLPGNVEKTEKKAPEKLVRPAGIKPENVVSKNVEKSISKQVSLSAKKETTKKKFDFTDYTMNLINNYGIRDGEQIPLLLIDDHNERRLYKKGLEFYGYRLIARPRVRPRYPYYFVINNSGIQLLQETCPYVGVFPSVLQEDRKLFERLLLHPQFGEFSKNQHQMFYAPMDTLMLNVIACKQKLILESMDLDIKNVSSMIGTFKKLDSSYILIIESVVTVHGQHKKVFDPDIVMQM